MGTMIKMQKTVHIPPEHRFALAKNIFITHHKDKILVINVNSAKWLVLQNNEQLNFFTTLNGKTISEAVACYAGSFENAREVIKQIIAKRFEEKHKKTVSESALHLMHLYLTNGCNLRCKHCYMESKTPKSNELTTEEIKELLVSFAEYGGKNVNLSGGEITLRKDLIEIIDIAVGLGLKTKLYSNGTLWTDELVTKLKSINNSFSEHSINVQISIDGFSEESNAKIRGKGSFAKAISTVEKLVEAGIRVCISITPVFLDDITQHGNEYAAFMKEMKSRFNIPIFLSAELLEGREVHLSTYENQKHIDSIMRIYEKFDSVNCYNDLPLISSCKQEELADNCMFGGLTVSSTGDIHFCAVTNTAKPVTNIRTTTFNRIIELQKSAIKKSCIDNLLPCKNCELKYICGGGCRIKEFPELTSSNIAELNTADIKPKKCSVDYKNSFYDLMIRINEKTFM